RGPPSFPHCRNEIEKLSGQFTPRPCRGLRRIRAVETRFARLFQQLLSPQQRWQMLRNSIENGGPLMACAGLLRLLDAIPIRPNVRHAVHFDLAENMRVPPDELVD